MYVLKDIKKLEKFYNSTFKKMEKLGNKHMSNNKLNNKQYCKLNKLCTLVDLLEPFFQKSIK